MLEIFHRIIYICTKWKINVQLFLMYFLNSDFFHVLKIGNKSAKLKIDNYKMLYNEVSHCS